MGGKGGNRAGGKRNKGGKGGGRRKGKQNTKHIGKHMKTQKAKQDKHELMDQHQKIEETKQTKKARELFNAGINALNEQPQLDHGLSYHDLENADSDMDDGFGSDFDASDVHTVASLQSEMTILTDEIMNDLTIHSSEAAMDDILNALSNKDGHVRVKALLQINEHLRLRRITEDDFVDKNMSTLQLLTKQLAASIRRGSVNEQLYALDTVSLLCLTMEDGLDFLMKYLQALIKNKIQRPKHAAVQIKAINTWATMVWSFGDEQVKLAALKLFEYFWNYNNRDEDSNDDDDEPEDESDDDDDEEKSRKKASKEIMCEAIDAWLFLITSIGSSSAIGILLDTYCDPLLQLLLLDSTSIDAKIYIGKALTVLIHNYQSALEDDEDFEEQHVNLDAVMREFNFLKSNAKALRQKQFGNQKAKFRDYLKTLEHKWTPLVVIKLHHKKFQVSGWNQWVQYHAVKKTLVNGLQVHLLQNEKVKEAFGIEIDAQRVILSKDDKKNMKKENWDSEQRIKKERGKKRDNKRKFMFDKDVTII